MSTYRPAPTEFEYAASIDKIATHFESVGDIKMSLRQFVKKERQRSKSIDDFLQYAAGVGSIIEPHDRSTGQPIDANQPHTSAMLDGALTGLILVKHVYGAALTTSDILKKKMYFEGDPEDMLHSRHQAANMVLEFSGQGLRLIGDAAVDKIETLEMKAVPDIAVQPSFRRGIGFIAMRAAQAHTEKELALLKVELESAHDIDWDSAFGKELGL